MPYNSFKDSTTGHVIQAIECGHGGTLMETHQNFEEGDYIVKWPVDLEGIIRHEVFPSDVFNKRFNEGSKKIDWKALGWPV